jgi:hypothetical protein
MGRFALVAMSLVAVACSELAADGSGAPGADEPSSAGPQLTVLEGHIVGDADHPGYTVQVPDGWSTDDGKFIVQDGPHVLGLSVWDVGEVPRNPCHWRGTETTPGPSVGELIEALTSQRLRDATAPTDVMLAGREGQYLELSVPEDLIVTDDSDFRGCDDPGNGHHDFVSWWGKDEGARWQQVAGQIDRVWVLDVDGQTLLVDATYSPDTSASDREELDQVVASLRFAEA